MPSTPCELKKFARFEVHESASSSHVHTAAVERRHGTRIASSKKKRKKKKKGVRETPPRHYSSRSSRSNIQQHQFVKAGKKSQHRLFISFSVIVFSCTAADPFTVFSPSP